MRQTILYQNLNLNTMSPLYEALVAQNSVADRAAR
jgi:hypothetical protein